MNRLEKFLVGGLFVSNLLGTWVCFGSEHIESWDDQSIVVSFAEMVRPDSVFGPKKIADEDVLLKKLMLEEAKKHNFVILEQYLKKELQQEV